MDPGNRNGARSGHRRPLRALDSLVDYATGLLFLAGAFSMFAMVVTRYGFAWSDPSVEILVVFAMIWGTFVGVSAGVRHGINIRFSLIEQVLTDNGVRIVRTFAHFLTLAIALGLALSGYALFEETRMFNEVMPTALRWPVWPFHVSVFAGGLLLSVQVIRSVVGVWRHDELPDGEMSGGAV